MTTDRVLLTVEEYLDELLTHLLDGSGPLDETDEAWLRDTIRTHLAETDSAVARRLVEHTLRKAALVPGAQHWAKILRTFL